MIAHIALAELRTALQTLAGLVGRASGDAAWVFESGALTIEWAGGSRRFTGAGDGAGVARVRGGDMVGLAGVLEGSGAVAVRVAGARLHIGTFSVETVPVADAARGVPQLLPVDASLADLLRVALLVDRETVTAAGLNGAVADALRERAERVEQARALLAPVGVTTRALDACIDACLTRGDRPAR